MVMCDGHSVAECRIVVLQPANGFVKERVLLIYYGKLEVIIEPGLDCSCCVRSMKYSRWARTSEAR